MKTKTLYKQLMSLGLSRNEARKVVRMGREAGLSNGTTFEVFCHAMMEWLVVKAFERLDTMTEADYEQ